MTGVGMLWMSSSSPFLVVCLFFLQSLCCCQALAPIHTAPSANKNANLAKKSQLSVATALPLEVIPESEVVEQEKVGVMLLNLGGPETGDDVEGM